MHFVHILLLWLIHFPLLLLPPHKSCSYFQNIFFCFIFHKRSMCVFWRFIRWDKPLPAAFYGFFSASWKLGWENRIPFGSAEKTMVFPVFGWEKEICVEHSPMGR